jgi:hypothetical protein
VNWFLQTKLSFLFGTICFCQNWSLRGQEFTRIYNETDDFFQIIMMDWEFSAKRKKKKKTTQVFLVICSRYVPSNWTANLQFPFKKSIFEFAHNKSTNNEGHLYSIFWSTFLKCHDFFTNFFNYHMFTTQPFEFPLFA